MSDSILTTVKKTLGLGESDTTFDVDVLLHINSVFATLNQVGVGPDDGYEIEDASATWDEFIDDARQNSIKGYVALRVRMLFDPPPTSFAIEATERVIKEYETRIYMASEVEKWE